MAERDQDHNEEFRLKQLEFLMKIVQDETASVDRWGRLLVLGNAGGIGVGLIIYKDLLPKFDEATLLLAIVLFVAGLVFSGIFLVFVSSGFISVRMQIKDFVFSKEDIAPLQKKIEKIDHKIGFAVTFLASILSFAGGIVAILLQTVK